MTAGRVLTALLFWSATMWAGPIEDAFNRLYNFDFAGSHKILDAHLTQHPDDPLGHALRAATHLFSELDRMKILEAEFVIDDKRISGDEVRTPDLKIRDAMYAAITRAQELADARLKKKPDDTIALFSFCLTEGIRTDYMAFIENKQFRSLFAAKKSQSYALEIIKRDPTFVDAKLTTGISEYLIGSLPFFLRWFVRFDQVKGSKDQAIANLELVAAKGRYLGPYSRILLAMIHLREKRPAKSIALLDELSRDFPGNPLIKKELGKLREKYPGNSAR